MKTCKNCLVPFEVFERDKQFYAQVGLPEPTWCPHCREQRRFTWRNLMTLHSRICNASGEKILSAYSQDVPFPVYKSEYWYSDSWNGLDYGQDFDFSRPFFEQFNELLNKVPQLALSTTSLQNCDFVNQSGWCKDCYLSFESDYCEGCMYNSHIVNSRSCSDCMYAYSCELCYENVDCKNCYNVKFSENSNNCSDSVFLKNCIGCKDCFGCVNLKNKQYFIWNKQYTKEEYFQLLPQLSLKSRVALDHLKAQFDQFKIQFPVKNLNGINNENSVGDYLSNTQNCYSCFDCEDAQDCSYVFYGRRIKNVYDMTVFGAEKWNEFCCEVHEIGEGCRNLFYCDQVWNACSDLYYSKLCINGCNYLFGCIGLKHVSYCILNKQYTKEEYEALVPRIIEHMKQTDEWGEFFPSSMSPFPYNDTEAVKYYPLNREEAIAKGYKWADDNVTYLAPQAEVPDNIDDVEDSLCGKVLSCKTCTKNYKIVSPELKHYRSHGVPVPVDCFQCRNQRRFKMRNSRNFILRNCNNCQIQMYSTVASDRPEKVYCEKCYLEAVY